MFIRETIFERLILRRFWTKKLAHFHSSIKNIKIPTTFQYSLHNTSSKNYIPICPCNTLISIDNKLLQLKINKKKNSKRLFHPFVSRKLTSCQKNHNLNLQPSPPSQPPMSLRALTFFEQHNAITSKLHSISFQEFFLLLSNITTGVYTPSKRSPWNFLTTLFCAHVPTPLSSGLFRFCSVFSYPARIRPGLRSGKLVSTQETGREGEGESNSESSRDVTLAGWWRRWRLFVNLVTRPWLEPCV